MDHTVRRDFERPFIEIRISGELDVMSSSNRIGELRTNKHYREGMNLLFDLRSAQLHSLDIEYMNTLRSNVAHVPAVDSKPGDPGTRRVAFLVANESDEMVMKLYKEMLDLSPGTPVREREIFMSYAAAVSWIGGAAHSVSDRAAESGRAS
ncbi:hypothetical protein [Nisaea sp.]|uniref:hypothetical protein n=1 Tax=Nisaea sp. TaxID=2024842 RepID=UPI003B525C52